MTVPLRIVEKIKSMKSEGYSNKEIAKKCKVSTRTIGKKLKEPDKTELATSQTEKPTDDLEEHLKILELRPKVENKLTEMIRTVECKDDANVLMEQLCYLQGKLEDATDIEGIKKIEKLITEGTELSKKVCDVVDRWTEKVEKEAEEERKKAEEKRKEYDRRYAWLKRNLVEVIEDVNAILPWPITERELEKIIIDLLPYGKPIFVLINPRKLTKILEKYVSKDDAEAMSRLWDVSI